MHKLLLSVLRCLEQESIQYCLMRDYDQLDHFTSGGEIDLLVAHSQLRPLATLLARLGFVAIRAWGHAPHHFFLAYDQDTDCWLKLDVVTEIAYGKPSHFLRTTLAANCLSRRKRCKFAFVPSAEDELVTLLLHCVLDKRCFTLPRQQRLHSLCQQIADESYLLGLLAQYWSPAVTWPQLATQINSGQWDTLVAEGAVVTARLASRDRFGAFGRQSRDKVLRKLNRWIGWLRPQACAVALLAPDGAGKSTLATDIQQSFYFPVQLVYMGLYQKKGADTAPVRVSGVGFVRRLFRQWQRYLTARYHQAKGRFVIFDRYTYDALLPSQQHLSRMKQWRRWLLAHACPAPDLVLILDAPGEVLYARKEEHSAMVLEEQRQGYLKLQQYLPRAVVVDATREVEHVRREVTSLMWRCYSGHLAGAPS
jgi:hypothetical protein